MFLLFLHSVLLYGDLDENTVFLVYTSTAFMNKIKKNDLYNASIIRFEINDGFETIDQACKARLDLFRFESIALFDKILYLDTDIVVRGNINRVFDVCTEDVMYALEEGSIDDSSDYWGKSLFGEEVNNYTDKTAFSGGVLLFKNCKKMKELFEQINHTIATRFHPFYDQGYIVYCTVTSGAYNNKTLKDLAVNLNFDVDSDKIIHHFPGGPGVYEHKIAQMGHYLNALLERTIAEKIAECKKIIVESLFPIIEHIGEKLEGSIFMQHLTNTFTDVFLHKSKNICKLLLNKNIKNVMEVGFNSGFSTLLMLVTNPHVRVTSLDLGDHKYTLPCYEKIKEMFGDRVGLVVGNSLVTLPKLNEKYDLIHIDGGHSTEVASSDISNAYRLSKHGTTIIMDDYDFYNLHPLWDFFVDVYKLKKPDFDLFPSPHHDVKIVNFLD